ncbi:hypothetical protein NL676_023946 [Syzygium grande]|nr:hypothetical protein NL676_023946 [Syzygium grande]
MRAGEAASDDLLGVLLISNMKENVGMSLHEVIEECKLFYFARQETTSVLLVWTAVLLSVHSDWQARAREEVLQVFGSRKPDFDRLSHLKILSSVLLRVGLVTGTEVISTGNHGATQASQGNKTREADHTPGVQLSIPHLLIHHDRELWGEDAEEYKPERLAEGVSKATKNQVSFFPVWMGPSHRHWPKLRIDSGEDCAHHDTSVASVPSAFSSPCAFNAYGSGRSGGMLSVETRTRQKHGRGSGRPDDKAAGAERIEDGVTLPTCIKGVLQQF